jgi:hypothetical protein
MPNSNVSIRIINAALDEIGSGSDKKIVLRGVVDPICLQHLKVDDYQREAQPLQGQASILDALTNLEALPDIELGMRGQRFSEDGHDILLHDDVYIVDGLQRVTTAIHFRATNPGKDVRLGATIHFDTTKMWERDRFRILNSTRLKVSPNILLRNMRDESSALRVLYGLTQTDNNVPLKGRVQWGQRMARGELITALVFLKVAGMLHTHKAPAQSTSITQLVPALNRVHDVFGVMAMQSNVKVFWELVDECWGIRRVQYREGAVHLRGTFLLVLAKFLSDHYDFWPDDAEKKLVIPTDLRKKIKAFPVTTDQHVMQLTGSSGQAKQMLYLLLLNHVNAGRRTRRLRSRHPTELGNIEAFEQEDESKAA